MAKTNPFATFLIIGPTCFFLGILFASFPYDYNVLWSTNDSAEARDAYFAILESHLRFLHASPPLISRILNIVIGVGLLGFISKLYRPSEANLLFDGASLVLYMCGVIVYVANIVKGLRLVTDGTYGVRPEAQAEAQGEMPGATPGAVGGAVVGREDSLRVLCASNTILALVMVGVLVLQAGQWYAQRKEDAEMAEMDRVRDEKHRAKDKGGSGKKRQ